MANWILHWIYSYLLHEIFEGLLDASEAISSGHVQVKFAMEHHKHHGLKKSNVQENMRMQFENSCYTLKKKTSKTPKILYLLISF